MGAVRNGLAGQARLGELWLCGFRWRKARYGRVRQARLGTVRRCEAWPVEAGVVRHVKAS